MAKKYLDPKADLTFKKVFGEHPDLVISPTHSCSATTNSGISSVQNEPSSTAHIGKATRAEGKKD